MKCCECQESNATEICSLCGAYYCEECAENRDGHCDCEIPPTIYPIKSTEGENK